MNKSQEAIYKNLPNIVSIFGVLGLSVLSMKGGYKYIIPLIIYNNIMDDLDGILAGKLNLRSDFGARLDNVCDAVSHIILVMVVGMRFGGICSVFSLIASAAILVRVVSRLAPNPASGIGSPTNELIRHMFFVLLLANIFMVNPSSFLIVVFAFNSVSLLVSYRMPHMVRSMTKSAIAVSSVNIAMILAWLIPSIAPVIAACFILTYLYSFVVGGCGVLISNRQEASICN